MQAKVGDRVGLDAKKVGQPVRIGTVERVAEGLSGIRYEIRWEDGSSSIVAPSAGTLQVLGKGSKGSKGSKSPGRAKAQVTKGKAGSKAARKPAGRTGARKGKR